MDASQIDHAQYDYIHFGFGEVTADYDIALKDVQDQFDVFKKQSGFKKIISFGGWSFSTSEDSFPIFRHSVSDSNRALFAQNIINFIHNNNFDGVDFDWEYPGAPDIPGIPPGSPEDGTNYVAFLKVLRAKLDPSKTISIAAPASYWYLKGFPLPTLATSWITSSSSRMISTVNGIMAIHSPPKGVLGEAVSAHMSTIRRQ